MTKTSMLVGSAVAALAGLALAAGAVDRLSPETALEKQVERGRYLVSTSGCHDCHTPWVVGPEGPEPDMSRALSGHPEDLVMPPAPDLGDGPWGVSFTANLTPDENTGIGIWTEDIFVRAIRSGRHWGVSRPILPPMPWKVYGQMTDQDLKSIYAYLRTIQPIHNRVPEPLPPAAPALPAAVPAS